MMPKTVGPLNWFGGKAQVAPWILGFLPPHHRYVEVFGGAAALLFTKSPSPIEVYNDVDQGLVEFFRVLRDPRLFPEFFRRVQLVPYSRAEYITFRQNWQAPGDPIEQALRWFVVARWSFSGQWGSSWSYDIKESHANGPAHISRWLATLDQLPAFHQRLMRVFIEQDDWRVILDRYDGPDTAIYADPPYVPETRKKGGYSHELTTADHHDLVSRLLTVQGMVLLSGYKSPVYQPLEAAGWVRQDKSFALRALNARKHTGQRRVESLWLNPACQAAQRQLIFWAGGDRNANALAPADSAGAGECEPVGSD